MQIEFDPNKDAINRQKHGLSLTDAVLMNFDEAAIVEDHRFDYGETRFLAYVPIAGRLHVLWFTMRGSAIRVIGLRKANRRERERYEQS